MPYAKPSRSYLASIKDWKIRSMVAGYIEARMLFKSFRLDGKNKKLIPFEELRQICDLLYEVREHHQLLFRRPQDPTGQASVVKLSPGAAESDFLSNVALLFHKVLMARELRYVLDHFSSDAATSTPSFDALRDSLEEIDRLFDVSSVINLIHAHRDNAILIAYLIEDSFRISKVLQVNGEELLLKMTEAATPEKAFMIAARYYIESGWYDKTCEMLKRVLKVNPEQIEAGQLLDRYSKIPTLQS